MKKSRLIGIVCAAVLLGGCSGWKAGEPVVEVRSHAAAGREPGKWLYIHLPEQSGSSLRDAYLPASEINAIRKTLASYDEWVDEAERNGKIRSSIRYSAWAVEDVLPGGAKGSMYRLYLNMFPKEVIAFFVWKRTGSPLPAGLIRRNGWITSLPKPLTEIGAGVHSILMTGEVPALGEICSASVFKRSFFID